MSYELFAAFVAATTVLILMPGPNVSLIVANSIAHGAKYGLVAVAGTSSAMVIQLTLTVLGLTSILGLVATWFEWLRWLGVAYLIFLGLKAWAAPAVDLAAPEEQKKSIWEVYWRGFLVSLTNPKTLLFYTAFLPQFISADHDRGTQLLVLAATFLVIATVLDSGWAMCARCSRLASRPSESQRTECRRHAPRPGLPGPALRKVGHPASARPARR